MMLLLCCSVKLEDMPGNASDDDDRYVPSTSTPRDDGSNEDEDHEPARKRCKSSGGSSGNNATTSSSSDKENKGSHKERKIAYTDNQEDQCADNLMWEQHVHAIRHGYAPLTVKNVNLQYM